MIHILITFWELFQCPGRIVLLTKMGQKSVGIGKGEPYFLFYVCELWRFIWHTSGDLKKLLVINKDAGFVTFGRFSLSNEEETAKETEQSKAMRVWCHGSQEKKVFQQKSVNCGQIVLRQRRHLGGQWRLGPKQDQHGRNGCLWGTQRREVEVSGRDSAYSWFF